MSFLVAQATGVHRNALAAQLIRGTRLSNLSAAPALDGRIVGRVYGFLASINPREEKRSARSSGLWTSRYSSGNASECRLQVQEYQRNKVERDISMGERILRRGVL